MPIAPIATKMFSRMVVANNVNRAAFIPDLAESRETTAPIAAQGQLNVGNKVSPITIVAAITSTLKRPWPFQVYLPSGQGGLDTDSVVTLNHIRSIDRQRLVRRLGLVTPDVMKSVDQAILVSLGVDLYD